MITLVIYGLIAVALAASAGYAFLTFTSSSRQLTQLQENQVRMDTAVAAIRASLLGLSNNGVAYVPEGVAGTSYMQLPSQLGVVSAAPWGQPYEYCPLSVTGITNSLTQGSDTVSSADGSSYSVGYYSGALTNNTKYVVTSNLAVANNTQGYIAYIVSTLSPGAQMPSCASVVSGASGVTVPNGTVRAVTAGFNFMQRINASSDRMELYVAGTASGDSTGRDVNNLATFDSAMATWSALQPRLALFYLRSSLTATSNFAALDPDGMDIRGQNASLVVETDPNIKASGGGNYTLTLSSGLAPSAATTFQNLTISEPNTIITYMPLTFRNVTYTGGGNIEVYNAALTINDSTLSNVGIYATNSRVSFLNDNAASPTSLSGTLAANLSTVSFEAPPGLVAGSFTLTPPANNLALVGTDSDITIGSLNASGISYGGPGVAVSTGGTIALNGGSLNVNGSSTLSTASTLTVSPVVAMNAHVTINGTMAAASSSQALQAIGSNVYINGTLNANSNGAILGEAATLTGGAAGKIKINVATNPCIEYFSTNGALIPLYYTLQTSGAYSGYATFLQAQLGFPPILTYTTETGTLDATVAGGLTQSTTSGTDPYINGISVIGTATGAIVTGTATGYLDKTSFEAGVRSIVNQEFRPGINMYFPNTVSGCLP